MSGKLNIIFINSFGALLFITAAAKLASCFGHARILNSNDPLFNLSFRTMLVISGALELAVAFFVFLAKKQIWRIGIVAWIATIICAYRIGVLWVGHHKPCPCLGNLTDALHIPPQTADTAMKIILAYLLLGSYAYLFWLWRQRKNLAGGAAPP